MRGEPPVELSEESAADSATLQRRLDVDPVQLRLGALAVVVEEAYGPAGVLGDEEVGVLGVRAVRDALAHCVECVALLDDRRHDRLVADEVPVRLADRDPSYCGDRRRVGRNGIAHDGVKSTRARHGKCLGVRDPAPAVFRSIAGGLLRSAGHVRLHSYTPKWTIFYSWEEYLSSRTRELTTTSHAILGLLAIRPWSTYELARQMRRSLRYVWPRAESNLYAEPKRLVDGGFAEARSEPVGKRRRTVYSITAEGRAALASWLAEPATESRLESETLVKLLFAPCGSKENLLDHLRRFRDELETKQQALRAIFRDYLDGQDPFPERVHVNVVCYRLIWDQTATAASWVAWAIELVERWPDVAKPADRRGLMNVLEHVLAPEGAATDMPGGPASRLDPMAAE